MTAYKITIDVLLRGGRSLSNLQVFLFIPPSFTSSAPPNRIVGREDPPRAGYQAIYSKNWDLLKPGVPFHYEFNRIHATESGTFTLYYMVNSEQYSTEIQELKVEVVDE